MISEFSIINLFLFATSFYVLFYAGGLMVRSLVWMGRFLHLSEYVLAFVLAAFATSLPEFFVGIHAALQGFSSLSVGNVVGANFLNITLVIGVTAVMAGSISMDRGYTRAHLGLGFTIIVFPLLLLLDGLLSRADGFLLLFLFGGYLSYLIAHDARTHVVDSIPEEEYRVSVFLKKLALFFFGVVLLLGSAWFIVSTGIEFGRAAALPFYFIGILIAIGTTLPEVVFGVRSVSLGHTNMSIGNALGSIAVNTSLVLGVVAIIQPIRIESPLTISLMILLTGACAVWVYAMNFVWGGLSRRVGIVLLIAAFLFIFISGMIAQ